MYLIYDYLAQNRLTRIITKLWKFWRYYSRESRRSAPAAGSMEKCKHCINRRRRSEATKTKIGREIVGGGKKKKKVMARQEENVGAQQPTCWYLSQVASFSDDLSFLHIIPRGSSGDIKNTSDWWIFWGLRHVFWFQGRSSPFSRCRREQQDENKISLF